MLVFFSALGEMDDDDCGGSGDGDGVLSTLVCSVGLDVDGDLSDYIMPSREVSKPFQTIIFLHSSLPFHTRPNVEPDSCTVMGFVS